MGEYRRIFSSRSARNPIPVELRRLQSQQDNIHTRVLDMKTALEEKDLILKSQSNTIKLYEHTLRLLKEQNSALKHSVSVLSDYITGKLQADLPLLPDVPQDLSDFQRAESSLFVSPKKKGKRKTEKVSVNHSFSFVFNQDKLLAPSQSIFQDFSGADFLKALLEAQMNRKMFQKTALSVLGGKSKEILMRPTQVILFQTLSFFLSCRNVAFMNNLDVFFPRVLEMLLDLLEVEQVTIYEKDESTGNLYCKATTGSIDHQMIFAPGFGHFEAVFRGKSPIVITNAAEDVSFDQSYNRLAGIKIKNLACVALATNEEIFGVLECCNKRRPFAPADLIVLNQVAKQLVVGFMGTSVKEKIRKLVGKGPRPLHAIDSSQDALFMPLLQTLLNVLLSFLNCERATLFTYDQKTHELVSLLGTGLEGVIRVPMNRSIASAVFNTKSTLNVHQAASHPAFLPDIDAVTGFQTRDVLAVSIGSKGVLECLNKKSEIGFTESDEKSALEMVQVFSVFLDCVDNMAGTLLAADWNEVTLQAISVAVLHINTKGLIQQVNRFASDLFHLAPERLVGMALSELLEDTPKVLSQLLSSFQRTDVTTLPNLTIFTFRDLKAREDTKVTMTVVPVTGESPGYVLVVYPLNS